jgi:hypothetical protein
MKKTDKQKLFEAFEKVCNIKLIKENKDNDGLPAFLYIDDILEDGEIRMRYRDDKIVTKEWNKWKEENCNTNSDELPPFIYMDEDMYEDKEIRTGYREDTIVTKKWNDWLSKNCK